jgi:hypothetical protein
MIGKLEKNVKGQDSQHETTGFFPYPLTFIQIPDKVCVSEPRWKDARLQELARSPHIDYLFGG